MQKRVQKLLAFLLVVALVCAILPIGAVPVAAEKDLLSGGLTNRMQSNGKMSIGFRFAIQAKGVSITRKSVIIRDDATVEPFHDGAQYQLVGMGVLMANTPEYGTADKLVKESVPTKKVTDVAANYALKVGREEVSFAARLKDIPVNSNPALLNRMIYARPYYVYEKDGVDYLVYGDIAMDTVCGKHREYTVELPDVGWTVGDLDSVTGAEVNSDAVMRTGYINSADLMISTLPANTNVVAYFYGCDGYLSSAAVAADWTALTELDLPEGTTCIRLVARPTEGASIADAAAFSATVTPRASRSGGVLPLVFYSGGLSHATGAEKEDATRIRTAYLPIADALINPRGATAFTLFFYDAEQQFISSRRVFTQTAQYLSDFVPEGAVYVRILVRSGDNEDISTIFSAASHVHAYLSGSEEYRIPTEDPIPDAPQACEHVYDHACDADCNVCGAVRVPADHVYDDAYDGDCNVCGVVRDVPERPNVPVQCHHAYSNACDATCNWCGASRVPADHVYDDIYDADCNECGAVRDVPEYVPDELFADVPANQGVKNALLNMQQLVKLTYKPLADIPQQNGDLKAGSTYRGAPYSSSRLEQLYIGSNVSFHTFMTALQNPNSYLYTVDLGEDYGNKNGDTYYGVVCSTAVGYALGIVPNYTTYQWTEIPGMELLEQQSVYSLQLGDTIVGEGHVVLITGIQRDKNGKICNVEVSEAGGYLTAATTYTAQKLAARFPASRYQYCRYTLIDKTQHIPSAYVPVGDRPAQTVTYNTALIPRKGDKANWLSSQTVEIDVLSSAYSQVEIYKDDILYSTQNIPKSNLISLADLDAGSYKARLKKGSSYSDWCYWIVVDTDVVVSQYEGARRVRLDFTYSDNAKPLYVQWMNGTTNATIHITLLNDEQIVAGTAGFKPTTGLIKVRIAFQTEYGVVYSELPEAINVY